MVSKRRDAPIGLVTAEIGARSRPLRGARPTVSDGGYSSDQCGGPRPNSQGFIIKGLVLPRRWPGQETRPPIHRGLGHFHQLADETKAF